MSVLLRRALGSHNLQVDWYHWQSALMMWAEVPRIIFFGAFRLLHWAIQLLSTFGSCLCVVCDRNWALTWLLCTADMANTCYAKLLSADTAHIQSIIDAERLELQQLLDEEEEMVRLTHFLHDESLWHWWATVITFLLGLLSCGWLKFWLKCLYIHTYIHPFNGPLSGTTQVSR